MTTTDPQRLVDAMDHAIRTWSRATGQTPPMAIFCGEEHPFDGALCRRLDGHSGVHAADGKAWETTTTDPKDET